MTVEWKYASLSKKSSGYEENIPFFKEVAIEYKEASEERKQEIIQEVFIIYREKNIFPITYFNEEGILEEIKKCREKKVEFKEGTLDIRYNQGQTLCRFLFPNLQEVVIRGVENNSPYHKFMDDVKLKRAIKFGLDYHNKCVPSEIKNGLEMIGGNVATNFKTMVAKALYEKYTPKGGTIYDFASGFGGQDVRSPKL